MFSFNSLNTSCFSLLWLTMFMTAFCARLNVTIHWWSNFLFSTVRHIHQRIKINWPYRWGTCFCTALRTYIKWLSLFTIWIFLASSVSWFFFLNLCMVNMIPLSLQQKFVRCSVRAEVRHLRKVLGHRLNVEKHQVCVRLLLLTRPEMSINHRRLSDNVGLHTLVSKYLISRVFGVVIEYTFVEFKWLFREL